VISKFYHRFFLALLFTLSASFFYSQNNPSPAPYCNGGYTSGNCLQGGPVNSPGNSVNDFIDNFITSGANTNISNTNSGCNGNPNNYANYCNHYLSLSPGQVITCSIQSGITFAQGFAIFIDWNQDNLFNMPAERVAATTNVPGAATWTVMTFTVPPLQANGVYRMRVRCAWATAGTGITPCGTFGFGETEDYSIFIGPIPPNVGPATATLSANSPLCAGQTLSLVAVSSPSTGLTYTWTGPNSYSSTTQNPVISNAPPSASGIYTMNTSGNCPSSKTIAINVVPFPTFSITPSNPVICQGGSVNASVSFSPVSNPSLYSYTWSPSPGFGIFNTNQPNTIIMPPLIANTQSVIIYTLSVSRTVHPCPATNTMVLTINNPSTPTLNIPPPMCNTAPAFMLSATPGGGTWSANPAVSGPGSFSPALAAIGTSTLSYAVSVGTCMVFNTGTISVSQFITPALSSNPSTLCVQDQPFNLMGIVQNTTNGLWTGPAVSNGSFIPTNLPTGQYPLTYSTQSTPIASVCPASTLYLMNVFNPPVPVISPITPKCNTAPSVSLSASPSGGVWAGSGILVSGVQNPSQNLIGTNTLTYTAGQGTCVASSTATFHVSQFNTASLTASIPHQCVSNSPFNLMSIVQSTVSGVWNPAIGVVGTYSFNPAGLPSGVYTLTYSTLSSPDPNLCVDSKTISVSVLNPPAPIITTVSALCNTSPALQMSVTPNTGHWVSNSYLNANGVFTPSNCAPGNNLVQYVIGTPTCNISQGIQVSIEAFVPATILSTLPDQCNTNSAVNLLPYTANNSGNWSGPGVTGASFNPSIGAGQYVLTYSTASSPSGLCPDQSTLAIKVFSLAPPLITGIGPFCNSAPPIQLQVTPAGGIFGSPVFGLVSFEGLFYPYKGVFGDNVVSYSISSGPCVAYAQTTVNIERFVSADLSAYVGPFCRNSQAVNMNSFAKNPGGVWSGPGISGSLFDPSQANIGDNNVITYTTFSIPTATLCMDTAMVRIQVNQVPPIAVLSNTYEGCAPLQVLLNTPSANTGQGLWNLGNGTEPQAGLSTSYVYQYPGTYTVSFVYTDEIGCRADAELTREIKVYEPPVADFSAPEQVMISDPVVQFTNQSKVLTKNTYSWKVGTFFQSTELHPKVRFEKAGLYQVILAATTPKGCKHEVAKTIEVKNDFNAYIPDSFTPNYDGLNDEFKPVFTPYGLDAKTYEMEIFDRWGHSLFYTKDVNTGWNGTVSNQGSEELKEDVYVYKIKYKDLDGNIYNKMGHVSLLK